MNFFIIIDDGIAYTKGAGEVVVSNCKYYTDKNGKPRKLDAGIYIYKYIEKHYYYLYILD
jgi:hypothetical protein